MPPAPERRRPQRGTKEFLFDFYRRTLRGNRSHPPTEATASGLQIRRASQTSPPVQPDTGNRSPIEAVRLSANPHVPPAREASTSATALDASNATGSSSPLDLPFEGHAATSLEVTPGQDNTSVARASIAATSTDRLTVAGPSNTVSPQLAVRASASQELLPQDQELSDALTTLGAKRDEEITPELVQKLVDGALAGVDPIKLDAIAVLARKERLNLIDHAKKAFNCEADELFSACATSLGFGDRAKFNLVRLLLDQHLINPHEDDVERISTLLSPLWNPLAMQINNPADLGRWAESKSKYFPEREERLNTALQLDSNFLRKFEILNSIAPAIVRYQEADVPDISLYDETWNLPPNPQFLRAMTALNFDYSSDRVTRNIRRQLDLPNAIAGFRELCALSPDSLSNSFYKLLGHSNLLATHAKHDIEPGQSSEDRHTKLMQSIRMAIDCTREIPKEYLSHQGVQKLVAKIHLAALINWSHLNDEEKNLLTKDAIQLLQTTDSYMRTVGMSFMRTIFQREVIHNSDTTSRDQMMTLLENTEARQNLGVKLFTREIWKQKWQYYGENELLDKLLELPALSSLEYFDLFQLAQSAEDKKKIAQKIVDVQNDLSMPLTSVAPPSDDVLSNYALGMMMTYHLLRESDSPPSLNVLKSAFVKLELGTKFLKERDATWYGPSNRTKNEGNEYTPENIQLLENIAFHAVSTMADLSSAPFVTLLCNGRAPDEQDYVRTWANNIRRDDTNSLRNAVNHNRDMNSATYDIDEAFARHCVNEIRRTERQSPMESPDVLMNA